MRILHTSDWHLGKSLETKTRYEEQQHFIDEISDIIERKNIDVVILSGDVFDTSNPPAAAESMFFNSIVRLAKDRTCLLYTSLNDIATEELAHLEMVGAMVHQLTRGLTEEQIKAAGLDPYYVAHGLGIYPRCV